jgi:hypothetical protein
MGEDRVKKQLIVLTVNEDFGMRIKLLKGQTLTENGKT